MREPRGSCGRVAALGLLLSLCLAGAPACGPTGEAEQGTPAAPAEQPPETAAPTPRGISGVILRITKDTIAVRNLEKGSGGRSFLTLAAGPDTQVSGKKQRFDELRQGDLVAVAYQGDPPRATGVRVLPLDAVDPELAALAGKDLYKKGGRQFVGWIKQIDANTMVVRTPDGPKGSGRKGDLKTFARQPDTVVELLRGSWDELKKGDRVAVAFRKGEPRPAERVKVVLRGGEKPLPPGLATLLFDPHYDRSVQDVDGIGEWPPGKPWPASGEAARSEPQASEVGTASGEAARSEP